MKKIVVLSGKGGVGKSSIAASLAILLAEKHRVICVDCDVDASNLALALGLKESDFLECKHVSTNKKARLVEEKCVHCGKCKVCYFGAIKWNSEKKIPEFNPMKCEGCSACKIACPKKAIELVMVENARICIGKTTNGLKIVSGQLEIGESGSGKVVTLIKNIAEKIGKNSDFMIIDAAAGIGCPVIASVTGSDFVIAITEPTPSAISDLKRALSVVNHFSIPYGIVINKHDLNPQLTKEIEKFAKKQGVMVLAKIPYDKSFIGALVNMKPVIEFNSKTKPFFEEIAKNSLYELF